MFAIRRALLLGIVLWAQACVDDGVQPRPELLEGATPPSSDLVFRFPHLVPGPEVGSMDGDLPPGSEQALLPELWMGFPPFFKVTRAGATFTPDYQGHWIAHSTGYQESYAWGLQNDTYLNLSFQGDPVIRNQHAMEVRRYSLGAARTLNSRVSAAVWEDCGNTAGGQTDFTIWVRDVSKFPPVEYGHRSKSVPAQPTSQARCTTDVIPDDEGGDGGGAGGGGGGEGEATDWAAITCWYRVYYSNGIEVYRELMYCEGFFL